MVDELVHIVTKLSIHFMKIVNIVYNFQCIFQDRSIAYTARDKAGNENTCITNIKLVGMVMLCDINCKIFTVK